MALDVLCLRPESDFARAGVAVPAGPRVEFRAPDAADVPELMRTTRALLIPAVGPKLAPALFDSAGALKLVQITGAGVDRLDQPTLMRLGIPVANVPGGSNGALVEYTVGNALALLRRFTWADARVKAGDYAGFRKQMVDANLAGLDGAQVGIVGMGTIGLSVARAFAAFGAKLAYFDPAPRDPVAVGALGARSLPLGDLLSTSDVVSLHVPLLPETTNLIGAGELAQMQKHAVLINASRGGVVDETALAAALRDASIAGAAVDVYAVEPMSADNPLLALTGDAASRLILTPHIAGVSRQASATLFRGAWENVLRVLDGAAPLNRVY
ncbi:MAG: hydroxyacid dehydrogenase [Proteobacteria bacterium]|nr:hydroxyacid dehydrogenase [Burkholderiales bacterium]